MDRYFSAHCLNNDNLTEHVQLLECQPVKSYFPQNGWVPLLRDGADFFPVVAAGSCSICASHLTTGCEDTLMTNGPRVKQQLRQVVHMFF